MPRSRHAGFPASEESECENHQPVDERETTRPTGESPGPQERADGRRTGLNVSHGRHRPATSHCERPGAHNQGHRTRQDTPHDQDTCRVCSPAGRRNVSVERAVCVRRTPARGGGGQGCAGGGGPIYSRPGLGKLSGGTGVAGGSVGIHEVPAAGSSPLILRVGESACGVARVVRSWGSELGHGRLPPYPPLRAWRGPGLSGGWQAVAAGEWSRAAPTSPASAQGGCPTSGRPAGRGPYWPDRRRRSRRARRSDFDGQPPRWTMRPSVFTVRCPGAAGWPHVAHTPGRDSGMVVRPASSSAQR